MCVGKGSGLVVDWFGGNDTMCCCRFRGRITGDSLALLLVLVLVLVLVVLAVVVPFKPRRGERGSGTDEEPEGEDTMGRKRQS